MEYYYYISSGNHKIKSEVFLNHLICVTRFQNVLGP